MKKFLVGLVLVVVALVSFTIWMENREGSNSYAPNTKTANGALIPAPASAVYGSGGFILTPDTHVAAQAGDAGATAAAAYAVSKLKTFTGYSLATTESVDASISFYRDPSVAGAEAYTLRVDETGIEIRASSDAGLFYGAVSLVQLVGTAKGAEAIFVPAVAIADAPRFGWRGLMLDVARHFRSVDYVKSFIDRMAMMKMNSFHWHLTDDQGWRIEIDGYPKLTEVAAFRVPAGEGPAADIDPATGKPRLYGGFYTQDEIREVVAYAATRQITIVPEIDIPGHVQGLITAYPEFGTKPSTGKVSPDWGIFYETLNLEAETFTFLEAVFDQVIDLFPSKYIHIGGDEVQVKDWEESPAIQARMKELGIKDAHHIAPHFTNHFAKYLMAKGRIMVGWDEILEGGLLDDSTVMSWRGEVGGIEAAKSGHDAIMSPHPIMYLDHLQSDSFNEPTGRPLIQALETVYSYEPIPLALNAAEAKHILGVQANIWTEHMRTAERVTHMGFPRAAAVAEIGWSPADKRDFADFTSRLPAHFARLEAEGLGFADSAYEVRFDVKSAGDKVDVALSNQIAGSEIRYTLDGSEPTADSTLYADVLSLAQAGSVKAAAFVGGKQMAAVRAAALDPLALLRRNDDELTLCSNSVPLRLDDDAPLNGERRIFTMDIMKPCWIYEGANLEGISRIDVSVGNVPFNFQLGAQLKDVVFVEPNTPEGELVLFQNACDGSGTELARTSLKPALGNTEVATLSFDLPAAAASGNLCFRFAQHSYEPLWGIDHVQLVPAE
jgi:hexosaminidase